MQTPLQNNDKDFHVICQRLTLNLSPQRGLLKCMCTCTPMCVCSFSPPPHTHTFLFVALTRLSNMHLVICLPDYQTPTPTLLSCWQFLSLGICCSGALRFSRSKILPRDISPPAPSNPLGSPFPVVHHPILGFLQGEKMARAACKFQSGPLLAM